MASRCARSAMLALLATACGGGSSSDPVVDAGTVGLPEDTTAIDASDSASVEPPVSVTVEPLPVATNRVAAGGTFTCRIRSGELWCWGLNRHGEVGNGSVAPAPLPTRVGTDADWQFVSAGASNACAIRAGGQLFCWGDQELYDGRDAIPMPLTRIGDATDWSVVSVGAFSACGLRSNHTLWCWNRAVATPMQIGSEADWTTISVGEPNFCGLRKDGSAWCWQGPPGTSLPTRISPEVGWTKIVATNYETCGILRGALHCWGIYPWPEKPTLVESGPDAWTDLSGRDLGMCAVRAGSIWCAGPNSFGQLGKPTLNEFDGTTFHRVGTDTDWRETAVGGGQVCAVRSSGELACWGSRGTYQIGDGIGPSFVPEAIDATAKYASVDAGYGHVCARRTDGSMWCWGYNIMGSTGVPGSALWGVPMRMGIDTTWSSVSVGDRSCATRADGTLWCWGLGGRYPDFRAAAQMVTPSTGTDLADWIDVTAGGSHVCGRRDGTRGAPTLFCWGSNSEGQLGIGDRTKYPAHFPTEITTGGTGGVLVAAVGENHTCARLGDGTLKCWGSNSDGQLGVGTTAGMYPTPTLVNAENNWSSVSAGTRFTCATKKSGALFCWGANAYGQLGDGTREGKNVPTRVGIDSDWRSVAAGGGHTCALKKDNSLYCWGSNHFGQLGIGSPRTYVAVPMRVGTANDWLSVAAGSEFTCGIRVGGALHCWGANNFGQLGDGNGWTISPVTIP